MPFGRRGDCRDWDRAAWIGALDANMLTPIELMKAPVDAMIAFLCSVHADNIVGQNILQDGGAYPGTF